ncbi:hypothetical protein RND71_014603 [Anisodus tanguticus]|uniref:Uncharacterized protein n=1 Tax=Anisodus tanguticus TaxID=243964 RepID=A0AAE1SC66_9SOLA|nr:hypothetical protein RND71_014603 [Anisodus tanguticus]
MAREAHAEWARRKRSVEEKHSSSFPSLSGCLPEQLNEMQVQFPLCLILVDRSLVEGNSRLVYKDSNTWLPDLENSQEVVTD